MTKNLVASTNLVSREARERLLGQRGGVVWFTGLSGSGKSTLAHLLEAELHRRGRLCYTLDGDNLRHRLNSDLGFSAADRTENIRRIGEVAALFVEAGLIVLVAFISPFRADRARARACVSAGRFLEVFVETPLTVCELRDPKGFYRKARAGEIADFTGISSPYELPEAPELTLDTATMNPEAAVRTIVARLEQEGLIFPIGKT